MRGCLWTLCHLVDVCGNRYWWPVAVDQHTDYTVIAPCPSHESQAVAKKILKHWIRWAGPPDVLVCDGERGLGASEIFTENSVSGTRAQTTAGYSPRQKGRVEQRIATIQGSGGQDDFATPSGGKERHVGCQPRGCAAYARLRQAQLPPLAVPVRQALGIYLDKVMAPQPLGPMARGRLTTTGTQDSGLFFFSSPEDEHARSAVLLQFPCEQFHAGLSTCLEKFWATTNTPAFNKSIRIHSARLVFETRAKCQDFVARYKDDGIPYEVRAPFCNISTQNHSRPVQVTLGSRN